MPDDTAGRGAAPEVFQTNAAVSGRRRVVATTRALYRKVDAAEDRCEALERQLNIDRWSPEDVEYLAALNYQRERKYRLALDKVERLVVQRLFELQKCHIRGTSK